MISLLLAATVAGSSLPARIALQPTQPWVVDWNEARCNASRTFNKDGEERTFLVKASPRGNTLNLYFIKPGRAFDGYQKKAELAFGAEPAQGISVLAYGSPGHAIQMVNLTEEQSARLEDATTVSLTLGKDSTTYTSQNLVRFWRRLRNAVWI